MSTSAESALEWLDQAKPSSEEIKVVIQKLESRIQRSDDPSGQVGEIEALSLLQQVLLDNAEEAPLTQDMTEVTTPTPESFALTTDDKHVKLDVSALGDPAQGVDESLSADARRAKFLALKKQLSQLP